MVANHKESLVEQHYKNGSVDKAAMHELGSVEPHCLSCSVKQGGFLSSFSKQMKKLITSVHE